MKSIEKIRILVAAVILVVCTGILKAQNPFNCAVEAGAVLSFPADDMKGTSVGWQAGVTGEYGVYGSWVLESALRLKSKPTDGRIAFISGGESDSYQLLSCIKTNPVYIELPVRAGYVLGLSESLDIKISAGPYFGLGVFGKSKWSKTQNNVGYGEESDYNLFGKGDGITEGIMHRLDVGVSGKTELRFKGHYGITLEYTRQLNPMFKHYGRKYNQTLSLGLLYVL